MPIHPQEVFFLALIAAVATTLVLAWRQLWRSRPFGNNKMGHLPLLITTASYLFLLLCLPFSWILGPDYSKRRFTLIGLNCGLALLMSVSSILRRDFRRPIVGLAALILAVVWLIVGAIGSAV